MKRILIISPGPFSKSDNDGQTLEDFFQGWNKDDLAQFYITDIPPDTDFCSRLLNVSDKKVVNTLLRKSNTIQTNNKDLSNEIKKGGGYGCKKTPIVMLLRNILWSISSWETQEVKEWITSFKPDYLFFDIGDNAYLMHYVLKLKNKLKIPLLLHNTEGYYFFKQSYLKDASWFSNLFYPMWHWSVRRAFVKVMKETDYVFYCCQKLFDDYSKEFSVQSSVVYKSCLSPAKEPRFHISDKVIISYAGNLGYNRVSALIEVADCLKEISDNLVIDIYGRCKNQKDLELLGNHECINYHGFVSFEEVQKINEESDILIHVESVICAEEVRYGFTTKIPDCLGSGNVFFLFAPNHVACAEYIRDNIPEIVASSKDELLSKLKPIVASATFRRQLAQKCIDLCDKNHNKNIITERIISIINGI